MLTHKPKCTWECRLSQALAQLVWNDIAYYLLGNGNIDKLTFFVNDVGPVHHPAHHVHHGHGHHHDDQGPGLADGAPCLGHRGVADKYVPLDSQSWVR